LDCQIFSVFLSLELEIIIILGGISMINTRYRRYPRVYKKNLPEVEEKTIELSIEAAIGIVAVAFLKGIFWGYMIKRAMDK